MTPRPRLALALLSSAALLITGCASSGSPAATSDSGSSSGSTGLGAGVSTILEGIESDEALAALLPEKYQDGFVYGSGLNQPPGTFLADDGTTPIGFEIDLINAIAKRLGTSGTVNNADFSTLITSVQTNRIDLIISQMNDTAERQQEVDFVDYFYVSVAFLVPKGNPLGISGPEDLCGKTVTSGPGTTQITWAETVNREICPADEQITITPIAQNQQRLNSLKTGRLDVVLNDTPFSAYIAATSGDGNDFELVDLPEPIEPVSYGMGFNKENVEFRDAVQASLQSLMDDGTYLQILEAWNVESGARTEATVNGGAGS